MGTVTKASKLKYFSITKLFIGVITLLLIILAFVPYANVFIPDEFPEDQWWRPSYVWDDPILSLIYILFALLWIAFLFMKQPKARKAIMVVLMVVSFCWLVLSLGGLALAVQDFDPSYGVFISLLLFPSFITYLIISRILNRSNGTGVAT